MSAIRTIPRAAVNGYLRALRLPLSAAERVTGQRDNESWAPALAFESLEAKLEGAAGALLRDDELLEASQRREAKVTKLKEARTLESASELERAKARDEQRKREAAISKQRAKTEQAAEERKREAEAQAEQKKRKASEEAAKKESAARAQQAAQEKVIERRERATKSEALRAESEALDLTDEALKAQETVDLIDKTIEGNKEARKTG
jgi:outer membrane biosynthesis protein TonB